jgi:xanthine dehydrogenase accessory factor
MSPFARLVTLVRAHGVAALVTVSKTFGSAPREVGAWMAVRADGGFHGTIGGGRLEWEVLQIAREALAAGRGPRRIIDRALGPDLGQCCGGRVVLNVETFDKTDLADLDARASEAEPNLSVPVLLFGAGHVGRALALALAPLPFQLRWIDSRAEAFPSHIPANAETVISHTPEAEILNAPNGAFIVIMTHDHALDLAIVAAALRRDDLGYIGMIGSATKRARFGKRLAELGFNDMARARLICPIGLPSIAGKQPPVIAASVVAQLLEARPVAPTQPLQITAILRSDVIHDQN